MSILHVALLSESAQLPSRAHATDAGLDLYAPTGFRMGIGETHRVRLGIAVDIHPKHVGLILGRSSMNVRGISCSTGVIDAGYTGELSVVLTNNSDEPVYINAGDRIAQLVITPIVTPEVFPIASMKHTTARATGGFGSTGA